ncbi:MAG: hypothetical protein AB2A00_42995 [Myxococcota bacterium]
MRRLLLAALLTAALPAAADAPPVQLPPPSKRPLVVVDRIKGVGLLLPSAQQVAAAVVLELDRRYGEDAALLEDELHNLKQLRRMRTRGFVMPPEMQKTQDERVALLEWAVKEAPYRVRIGYKRVKSEYVATAECREATGQAPIHSVEGRGRTYDSAIEAIRPRLKTFCAVLDGAAAERARKTR